MDPPPPIASGSTSADAWPRRTAKACSNCRRDKVRCDGERPCSGCSKKHLQCLDGCEPCRRARARCEKTGPRCTRCVDKNIECMEESATLLPHIAPAAHAVSNERAKSACQNCRNDNKKCDDQRPCSRCVARSETCVPVAPNPKQARLRCEGCRKQNIRCEDARPCQNCVKAGTECVNIVRQARGCGTRVKAACISCRRSKTRCDGARPCGPCARRGSDCVEQVCRRCAHKGLTACAHNPQANSEAEAEVTGSTSNIDPAPPPPASTASNHIYYPMPWPTANSNPTIFAPMHPHGQPGPTYSHFSAPTLNSNSSVNARSPKDSNGD